MKKINLFFLFNLFCALTIQAQIHTFTTFVPGQVSSGNNGISTNLSVAGLTGEYLFFKIVVDFDTEGIASSDVAWSNSIRIELNGGGVVYSILII